MSDFTFVILFSASGYFCVSLFFHFFCFKAMLFVSLLMFIKVENLIFNFYNICICSKNLYNLRSPKQICNSWLSSFREVYLIYFKYMLRLYFFFRDPLFHCIFNLILYYIFSLSYNYFSKEYFKNQFQFLFCNHTNYFTYIST